MKQLLLLATALLLYHHANATVHYKAVGHTVLQYETYYMDIDNNGDDDYDIYISVFTNDIKAYIAIPYAKNFLLSAPSNLQGDSKPKAFNYGSGLGTGNIWRSIGGYLASQSQNYYWDGVSNKYLMIRLVVGTDSLYGWINMTVADDGRAVTVNSFAYDDVPDEIMLPGQGDISTSIIETDARPNFFSYQNHVVSFDEKAEINNVAVYDLTGRLIQQEENAEAIRQVNLDQPTGVYVLEMDSKIYGIERKRIFVQ